MIDPDRRNHTAIQEVVDGVLPVPMEEFGLADEGPLADEETHIVDVPETLFPLSDSMKMFVHICTRPFILMRLSQHTCMHKSIYISW